MYSEYLIFVRCSKVFDNFKSLDLFYKNHYEELMTIELQIFMSISDP